MIVLSPELSILLIPPTAIAAWKGLREGKDGAPLTEACASSWITAMRPLLAIGLVSLAALILLGFMGDDTTEILHLIVLLPVSLAALCAAATIPCLIAAVIAYSFGCQKRAAMDLADNAGDHNAAPPR